jgi:hypothetical protein
MSRIFNKKDPFFEWIEKLGLGKPRKMVLLPSNTGKRFLPSARFQQNTFNPESPSLSIL